MRRLLASITLVLAVLAAPAGARAQALHQWTAEPAWISNTGVYRHHELVYQDYLYDDHGANTDGFDHQDLPFGAAGFDPRDPTNPRLSPAPIVNYAGDFMYAAPDGSHMDDVADLWEMRAAADAGSVYLRFRLADMTAPDSSVVGVCVDEDHDTSTGVKEWPDGAGLTDRLGCDHLYTVYGTGADVTTPDGATTDLAKLGGAVSADPGASTIELRIPRSLADPGTGTWRLYAAAGIWDAASHAWSRPADVPQQIGASVATGGAPNVPAIWDLLSNNHEPNSTWDEEKQANELTQQDVIDDYLDVDFGRLASPRDDPDPQRTGVLERIYATQHPTTPARGIDVDRSLGTHFEYLGAWQPYAMVVPSDYYRSSTRRFPYDICSHPLGGNHNVEVYYAAALAKPDYDPLTTGTTPTTGYLGFEPITQLIDRLDGLYSCSLGRGEGVGYTGGDGLVDALEVQADVERRYRVDPDRRTIHGVSLGAIGTWYLARLYPDRYAAAMPYIFSSGVTGGTSSDPMLANLYNLPVFFSIGTADEFGQGTQGDPTADQLESEGDEYVYLHYLGRQHEGRIENDFLPFVEHLAYPRTRVTDPARVRYRFDPTKFSPKMPGDGSAYWVSGMKPKAKDASATIDATSLARADQLPTDQVVFDGLYSNQPKGYQARMRGLLRVSAAQFAKVWRPADFEAGWQQNSLNVTHTALPRTGIDNAFTVKAERLTAATLDAARMKLEPYGTITGRFDDDAPLHLVLAGRFGAHTRATLDGDAVDAHPDGHTVTVDVPAGKHVLVLDQPAPASRVCASRRNFVIRLPRVRHDRLARARVYVNGRRVRTVRGRRLRARVNLRGLPRGVVHVTVVARTRKGRSVRQRRTYRTCAKRKRA